MLNIVLFGPPGAGKGTQSEKMIERYNLTHVSTGDLLRKHICECTKLGKVAQKYIDEGKLVPDDLVIDMVEDKIDSAKNTRGFIFDGFPRTVHQAEALDQLLARKKLSITQMVALQVDDQELINRLLERGKTSGRSDDNLEKIKTRIEVYKHETIPVIDYYKNQGKYDPIHGVGPIEEIFSQISIAIENRKVKQ